MIYRLKPYHSASLPLCAILIELLLVSPGLSQQSKRVAGHGVLKSYSVPSMKLSSSPEVIFQDRSGYYWVGDLNGVSRYDEKRDEWIRFTQDADRLESREVSRIGQSSDNQLWFVPMPYVTSPYVSILNGTRLESIDHEAIRRHFIRPITAVFQGQEGELWFAAHSRLKTYRGQTWEEVINLSEIMGLKRTVTIRAGLQDNDKYLWLGTALGVVRFNERKREWKLYFPTHNSIVNCIYEDRSGRIWFSDNDGHVSIYDKIKDHLATYNIQELLPQAIINSLPTIPDGRRLMSVQAIYQDRGGQMMFATIKGLFVFNEGKNKWERLTPENSDLPSAGINTIMEDRAGRIWIGTGTGIVVLEP